MHPLPFFSHSHVLKRPALGRATLAGLSAFLLWLLVGLQAAYWGWGAWAIPTPEPRPLPAGSVVAVDPARIAQALGAGASPAPAALAAPGRGGGDGWRLAGVVAAPDGTSGAAVLLRDGVPARAYRVGATLPDGWRVTRVERTAVWLAPAQGGEAVRLFVPTPSR